MEELLIQQQQEVEQAINHFLKVLYQGLLVPTY